jgi:hypothetical protein
MEITTASSSPPSTPSSSTPSSVNMARAKLSRRSRRIRRRAGRLRNPRAALITIAARAAWGRSRNSGSSATAVSTVSADTSSDTSWVLAPARSLAADWLAPPPVMKPWNSPARTLARPVAVSSRSGWML